MRSLNSTLTSGDLCVVAVSPHQAPPGHHFFFKGEKVKFLTHPHSFLFPYDSNYKHTCVRDGKSEIRPTWTEGWCLKSGWRMSVGLPVSVSKEFSAEGNSWPFTSPLFLRDSKDVFQTTVNWLHSDLRLRCRLQKSDKLTDWKYAGANRLTNHWSDQRTSRLNYQEMRT